MATQPHRKTSRLTLQEHALLLLLLGLLVLGSVVRYQRYKPTVEKDMSTHVANPAVSAGPESP